MKFGCSHPPLRRFVATLPSPNSPEQNGASARRFPVATTLGFQYSSLIYGEARRWPERTRRFGNAATTLPHLRCQRGERRGMCLRGNVRGSGDEPAAGDRGDWRPEGEPSLQERLGGWPFWAHAVVRGELEPRGMDGSPGKAVLLPWPPRRAASPRDAGAQGLCLIQDFGSHFRHGSYGEWVENSFLETTRPQSG